METKFNLLDYDQDGLKEVIKSVIGDSLDLTPYRLRQIFQWVYRRRVKDFSSMTDISKKLREALAESFEITLPEIIFSQNSVDGSRKYLLKLKDGSEVESVLICQPTRFTLCVSSQVGCAIGCKFCRTAQMGLKRNLKVSEIIGQVMAVQEDVWSRGERGITFDDPEAQAPFQNIVFMGMGEPLHNKDSVISTVKILNDEHGLNFSGRKITVSTSGLIPAIKEFGESSARANLAISLNATTDEVRTEIMPINKRWPLEDLLETLRQFPLKAGRRITFEYVLLAGVNDTDEDMKRLPVLLRGIPAKINLIPYNSNSGLGYYPPEAERVQIWQKTLLSKGMNSTIRWSKGMDISAACGQLATESMRAKKKLEQALAA